MNTNVLVMATLIGMVLLAQASGPRAETPEEPEPAVVNGILSEGEYPHVLSLKDGKVEIHWGHDAESLWVAVRGKTTGWVAVGFDPEKQMKGANFLLAYVHDDSTAFRDAYGSGRFKHQPDTELGGKDNILECRGKEEKGVTTVEFKIPLDSGDQYDKPLKPKEEYPVLLGLGKKDDFRKKHFLKAKAKITLD